MSIVFKRGAHVPKGVTPEQILAELDDIEDLYGTKSPAVAAEAVLKDPERFPALRSFGPADEAEAFRDAIRRAVTYAVRIIVEVSDDADVPGPEVRLLHLVADDGGDLEWRTLRVIASDEKLRLQLIGELASDADAFAAKQRNVLEEIRRLLGG